jgi:hypothetical protein
LWQGAGYTKAKVFCLTIDREVTDGAQDGWVDLVCPSPTAVGGGGTTSGRERVADRSSSTPCRRGGKTTGGSIRAGVSTTKTGTTLLSLGLFVVGLVVLERSDTTLGNEMLQEVRDGATGLEQDVDKRLTHVFIAR